MNERDFRERLALVPCVRGLRSLPDDLRGAAERDPALRRVVDERVRLDALLDEADDVDGIETSPAFTEEVTRRAFRGDRTAGRHLVPLRTKIAAAAGLAAILVAGLLVTRERSRDDGGRTVAGETAPADPEMIARLDLFLDDWEAVLEHEEALDLAASVEVAEALDAFPDADDDAGDGEDGPR